MRLLGHLHPDRGLEQEGAAAAAATAAAGNETAGMWVKQVGSACLNGCPTEPITHLLSSRPRWHSSGTECKRRLSA
jgi:hypothetical protein